MNEKEVVIDFDEASREWRPSPEGWRRLHSSGMSRKNKKVLKNGCFSYKCAHLGKKNKYCTNKIFDEETGLCKYHCNKELLNSNIVDFFMNIINDH